MDDLYLKTGDKMVKLPKQIPTIEPKSLPHEHEIIWDAKHLEFSFKTKKCQIYLLLVASGLKKLVPNNWLKFHGYPMNRR